ncbi:hypothetical protein [Geodermatophilus sabuli]|uniref:hypothetical protein n=1 Tax=Geodermatophilus sabuli TaxID=1564158 RepID=UPI00117AA03B|nr:hypothetical protein [Geodermatophilus sabuli]MBB3084693.1 hypothetical protein [Geodermatophilus sabuli]
MADRTIDDEIDEVITTLDDNVARLMERVVKRELRDRHAPQSSTPEDYAAMAIEIMNPTAKG